MSEDLEITINPNYWEGPSYDDLVRSLGYTIVIKVKENDYSGQTLYLLGRNADKGGRAGLAVIDWGSCSGCDALQRATTRDCEDDETIDAVRDRIRSEIRWGTLADVRQWATDLDTYHDETKAAFIAALADFKGRLD